MTKTEEIEVTEMDLIYDAHDRLDSLLELLIEKKIITQREFEKKLDEMYEKEEINK